MRRSFGRAGGAWSLPEDGMATASIYSTDAPQRSTHRHHRGLLLEGLVLLTTIAGSLPKPSWLAEPRTPWAPWRASGPAPPPGKRDGGLIALKGQETGRAGHREDRGEAPPALR